MKVYWIGALVLLLAGCAPRQQSAPAPTLVVGARTTPVPIHVVPVTVRVPTVGPASFTPTPLPIEHAEGIDALVSAAKSWLGVRYLWGGCSKAGVDCSCAVRNWYAALGVNLPRVTTQQWVATSRVAQADVLPGDLVFFSDTCSGCGPNPTHVGMAIGGGLMIQAGGNAVSIQPIWSGFYGSHYMGAGRV